MTDEDLAFALKVAERRVQEYRDELRFWIDRHHELTVMAEGRLQSRSVVEAQVPGRDAAREADEQ